MPIAKLFPFLLPFLRWPGRGTDQQQSDNKGPDAPDLDRFSLQWRQVRHNIHIYSLWDTDTRRVIVVALPNPDGFYPPAHDPDWEIPFSKAAEALARHLNQLPPATVAIEVDERGRLVSYSTDPSGDETLLTDYLLLREYQLPRPVANRTVLRSHLYEVDRNLSTDVVSYVPIRGPRPRRRNKDRYIFKYSPTSVVGMWTEIQISARLPRHPNMILLDRLVLDEQTGSKVVGFTTRFIPSGSLDQSRPRFKLKWLKQLMQAVDDLNLKHGIIHQDIAHRNLLIDSASDSIVLIDFGDAYRVGVEKRGGSCYEGRWGERDDVKGVLLFLYQYITRDPNLEEHYVLHLLNEKDFIDPAKWVKHPDVELDDEVAEFYFELMAWVRGRRRARYQMKHYTEAPQPLEWPELPRRAETLKFRAGHRRGAGAPFLEWRRPPASEVDPDRRLLATGRYADEEAAAAAQTRQRDTGRRGSREPSGSGSKAGAATATTAKVQTPRNALASATERAKSTPPGGAPRARPASSPKRKRSSNEDVEADFSVGDAGRPAKRVLRRSARHAAKARS